MAVNQSFENFLRRKVDKINELDIATTFITKKDELIDCLCDAALDVDTISKSIFSMKQNLNSLKLQNDKCQKSIMFLKLLNDKIEYLKNSIPPELIQVLIKVGNETPEVHNEKIKNGGQVSLSKITNTLNGRTNDLIYDSEYVPPLADCRKTLFVDAEDNQYNIEPLNDIEFAKIPKYMIGRQTLTALNDFIASINKIMKAKYSLLALGKNGARKKGDLDLYLQFKKEETDVCTKKERKYFFTAEDYQREMKCKLDKTKLNLLTVLRHCRKIQELRFGKNIKYEVINGSR
ncbi:hypothetical protein PV327_000096 [Microctonus hyperodae]|uniref:SKA complex subunit 1 n=1 Tax=Microctonus hyperodae TaxID=165561 RepID=A0AA39G5I8_MICHY|nr:hypothetical protein PV327_000096 [Microctonus hyperodae]